MVHADDVFDVGAVRSALDLRLRSLESELHQVRFLQKTNIRGSRGAGGDPKSEVLRLGFIWSGFQGWRGFGRPELHHVRFVCIVLGGSGGCRACFV